MGSGWATLEELCYIRAWRRLATVENLGNKLPTWFIQKPKARARCGGLIAVCPESLYESLKCLWQDLKTKTGAPPTLPDLSTPLLPAASESVPRQLVGLEEALRESGLPDDARQSPPPHGIMNGNRNRYRSPLYVLLHDPVASTLAGQHEIMLFQNLAYFRA